MNHEVISPALWSTLFERKENPEPGKLFEIVRDEGNGKRGCFESEVLFV